MKRKKILKYFNCGLHIFCLILTGTLTSEENSNIITFGTYSRKNVLTGNDNSSFSNNQLSEILKLLDEKNISSESLDLGNDNALLTSEIVLLKENLINRVPRNTSNSREYSTLKVDSVLDQIKIIENENTDIEARTILGFFNLTETFVTLEDSIKENLITKEKGKDLILKAAYEIAEIASNIFYSSKKPVFIVLTPDEHFLESITSEEYYLAFTNTFVNVISEGVKFVDRRNFIPDVPETEDNQDFFKDQIVKKLIEFDSSFAK